MRKFTRHWPLLNPPLPYNPNALTTLYRCAHTIARASSKSNVFHTLGILCLGIGVSLATATQNKEQMTEPQVRRLIDQGKVIIAVNGKLYDITEFVGDHPGGAQVLSAANGHSIDNVWQQNEYRFHTTQQNVQDFLAHYYIGVGNLPAIPATSIAKTTIQLDYIVHNSLNQEPKKIAFDPVTGESKNPNTDHAPYLFVREHGSYQSHRPPYIELNYSMHGDAQHRKINPEDLSRLPSEPKLFPVICAGASRAHFTDSVDGTPWGQGADAVGTLLVKDAINLEKLLHDAGALPPTPCMLNVTGSDGYTTAIHSDEFKGVYLARDLPSNHGGQFRILGEGFPGFRNTKDVTELRVQPLLSKEELHSTLVKRLGDPMDMLTETQRQILAACPHNDAYVLRDKDKRPFGFNHLLPNPGGIITGINIENNALTVQGATFCGDKQYKPTQAEVCVDNVCTTTGITHPHDNKYFGLFKTAALGTGKQVTVTIIGANGHKQPATVPYNTRGLGRAGATATAPIPQGPR